jgi:hypothetical protein
MNSPCLQGEMAEDEAFFSRKGENFKPLKSRREVF